LRESSHHGWGALISIVRSLELRRGNVPDGPEESALIEPVDPPQGRELDCIEAAPRPAAVNDLRLEQADDGLGQGVVVRVANAADGALDPRNGEALGVPDRQIL